MIGGTSAGSMVSALYALGYTPDEILGLFKKYSDELVKINKFTIVKEFKNFVTKKGIKVSGLKTGDDLERIYNELANTKKIQKIKEIKMPLIIPAVDISASKKINFCSENIEDENYINDISIGEAVRASSSFPVIYSPFKYENYLFLDGGILDNVPAKEVKKLRSR